MVPQVSKETLLSYLTQLWFKLWVTPATLNRTSLSIRTRLARLPLVTTAIAMMPQN